MTSELEFEHFSQKVADAFVGMPSHTALPDFLGVKFSDAGPGYLVAEMVVRQELLTPFGNLHGGVIAVLVDHLLGSVMYPVMPRGWWAATTEYKVNNLAPVREGRLEARAEVIAIRYGSLGLPRRSFPPNRTRASGAEEVELGGSRRCRFRFGFWFFLRLRQGPGLLK